MRLRYAAQRSCAARLCLGGGVGPVATGSRGRRYAARADRRGGAVATRRSRMGSTSHLVVGVGVANIDGQQRGRDGRGRRGIAGDGSRLGSEGSELAGQAIDHRFLLLLALQIKLGGCQRAWMAHGQVLVAGHDGTPSTLCCCGRRGLLWWSHELTCPS